MIVLSMALMGWRIRDRGQAAELMLSNYDDVTLSKGGGVSSGCRMVAGGGLIHGSWVFVASVQAPVAWF
jgi:hypothetical protein